MNHELRNIQARRTRDEIANIRWIMEKAREFQKNIYFCFIDYAKAFDCVDHNKLWKILKELGSSLPSQDRKKDTDVYTGLLDSEGEGEGGMIWENGNSNMYTVM